MRSKPTGATKPFVADIPRCLTAFEQLNTVTECGQAAAKLVWCGPRVIPLLKQFLFEGRSSVVYQPRRAAVEALNGLGAKDVLIQYVTWKREIEDPATRFAEDSVRNAAARELARFRTKDVLEVLLGFALPHSRPGVVEALAQFGCTEAIPYFLRALEDDLCQASAMDGLRTLGREAELPLVTSALTRLPSLEEERPSSRRRRAKVLEILAEIGPSPNSWPFLVRLLDDDDVPIVTATVKIAIVLGIARQIVRALLESGVKVFYVTHMFDLAQSFHRVRMDGALFLRAERLVDGRRTFRLIESEPLPTSYGEDLYGRVFAPAQPDTPLAVQRLAQ